MLANLAEKLEVAELPGLEPFDERFGAISDLAQARRFAEASKLIEGLLGESIYDFRLVVYYLFHAVDSQKATGVLGVLRALNAVFAENWQAWGPANHHDKALVKSLNWLLQNANDLLVYHGETKSSNWKLFSARDDELFASIRDEFLNLSRHMNGPTWGVCGGLLAAFQRSVESEYSLLDAAPELEAIETNELEEAPVPDENEPDLPATPNLMMGGDGSVNLRASPSFFQLQNKLRAFEILVQKGQFEKAAVVSEDLMALINNFDPRQYFPDLFAGYFGTRSRAIQDMRPHMENRDPVTWDTLEQYYRVDLPGFVKD